MAAALTTISNAYKELTRVYIYTRACAEMLTSATPTEQTRFGRAMQLYTDWGEATSWMNPEILSVGTETVHRFLDEEPALG